MIVNFLGNAVIGMFFLAVIVAVFYAIVWMLLEMYKKIRDEIR